MNFSSLSSASKDDNGDNINSNIGINRFYSTSFNNGDENRDKTDIGIELEHSFAISIEPSSIRRRRRDTVDKSMVDDDNDSKKSIMLNYSPYQSILSPWKTMVDELRVLKPPPDTSTRKDLNGDKDKRGILLCVGSMAWSGGYWNGTPFLLVQRD